MLYLGWLKAAQLGMWPEDEIGNKYLVLGTLDQKAWRQGLHQPETITEMLPFVAAFKGYRTIEQEPGGWFPAEEIRQKKKPAHR